MRGTMTISFAFLLSAALIAIDRVIKSWALSNLAPVGTIPLIPGILKLTYVENYGAAFGILHGKRMLLLLVTGAIIAAACWLLLSKRLTHPVAMLCTSLIVAGGTGNLIDRAIYGFVVDYIDINELFSYPMFNFADCCVVTGAVLLAYYALVIDGKQKQEEPKTAEKPEGKA